AVTPLQDALMDSIPLVCLTGQVPTSLIGSDAFQECDTIGITRPCTKHNWLVKDVNQLAATIHEAFHVALTGFPITSTLMGLGAYPASGKNWMGMLGMHGTYEANMAMHDCDVMICIGARFDDRITGRLNAFSPNSKKIHIDIDPSSINKNVHTDVPVIGDVGRVLEDLVRLWRASAKADKKALHPWWEQIAKWRARDSLAYKMNHDVIMPQYAIQRLYALTKDMDTYITTEVGQHQMWAAQHYH
ncbi:MAG: hypothetical protein E5W27_04760, partial [Mesorhizobium sp.]